MKKFYKGDFESLSSVLDKVIKKLGIDRGLKEITLINLWSEAVPYKFRNNSKAVSVVNKGTYDALLVAVSSSAVSQELFLQKKEILKNLSIISLSLEFKIKDLILSTKLWQEVQEIPVLKQKQEVTHIFIKNPTEADLYNISVPEKIVDFIKESIKTQNYNSDELKNNMLDMIIKDIKTQIWRKNNGFPVCPQCGIPINYYNENKKILCPSCKYISDNL
ncbi:MAG: DUF721 domain-containing protein [Candidatus Gastranaerophilales bacterium]|nr:DUF721 domain-containing protein [Candidatus Gastranaerophilales bacterium]